MVDPTGTGDGTANFSNVIPDTKGITGGLNEVANAFDKVEVALGKFSRASTASGDNFAHLLSGFQNFRTAVTHLDNALPKLTASMPKLAAGFARVLAPLKLVSAAMGTFIVGQRIMGELLGATDALSSGVRDTYAEFMELKNVFGGTYDEAKKLGVAFAEIQRASGDADTAFVSRKELLDSAKAMAQYNIEISRMTEIIPEAGEGMNLLNTAALQAQAMGMTASEHMNLLSSAIMKTGLSSSEAFKQLAGFEVVAEKTGLSVDTVAKGLQQAVSNFQQLGLSADFARPLMIGFGESLSEVGIGIENAVALSQSLAKSLGGLGEDYGMAHLVSQLGGLSYGAGGGALSAGIGIQAAMLEAEDSGDFAALGGELATGMRNMLAGLGGGEIVTVSEANEDPSKAGAFYIQQQMLANNFGMSQTEATRTLEMLEKLDIATQAGDEVTADRLREQIADQKTGRNDTMHLMRKQNVYTAGIFAQAQMQTRLQSMMIRDGPGGEQLDQLMAEVDEMAGLYNAAVTAGSTSEAMRAAGEDLRSAYQENFLGKGRGENSKGTQTESYAGAVGAGLEVALAQTNDEEGNSILRQILGALGNPAIVAETPPGQRQEDRTVSGANPDKIAP